MRLADALVSYLFYITTNSENGCEYFLVVIFHNRLD